MRSTDVDRTLMSAVSHLAALYSQSQGTYPNNPKWPTKWSPVPVHTVDHSTDAVSFGLKN